MVMQRQSESVQQQVDHISAVVDRIEKEQKKIKRDLALQPMRVYNRMAKDESQLMGPDGPLYYTASGGRLTIGRTPNISESDVDALAQQFHLPPFEKGTPPEKRRERLMKYLGFIDRLEDEPDDENHPSEEGEEELEDDRGEVVEGNEHEYDGWSD